MKNEENIEVFGKIYTRKMFELFTKKQLAQMSNKYDCDALKDDNLL